jgi:hypothetical protein
MKTNVSLAALAAAAAAVALGGAAQAQTAIDLNLGYTNFDEADAVTGRISGRFTTVFGAEGEASIGTDDALDSAWGLFAKGVLPLNDSAEVFARAGFAGAEGAGGADADGGAFGAGAQVLIVGRSGVRFDYTRYDFDNEIDAYSISYVFRLN